MAKDVIVKIVGDASGITTAFEKAGGAASAFQGMFAGVGMAIGQDILGLASKFAKFGFDAANSFGDLAMQTDKMQHLTGMTAEQSSKLIEIGNEAGVPFDQLATAIGRFDKNLNSGSVGGYSAALKDQEKGATELGSANKELAAAQQHVADLQAEQHGKAHITVSDQIAMRDAMQKVTDAQEKASKATGLNLNAFDNLKIVTHDAQGNMLPMEQILANVADRFDELGPGVDQSAEMLKMFGKGGANLIPILSMGGDAIRSLSSDIDASGTVLDEAGVKKGKEYYESQKKLDEAWKGMQITLGEKLAPKLKEFSDWMTVHLPMMMEDAQKWLDDNRDTFKDWGDKIQNAFGWLRDNGPTIIADIKSAFDTLRSILDPIVGSIQTITNKLADLNDKLLDIQGKKPGQDQNALSLMDLSSPFAFAKKFKSVVIDGGHAAGGVLGEGWSQVGENGPEWAYTRGGQTSVWPSGQQPSGAQQPANRPQTIHLTIPVSVGGKNLGTVTKRIDLAVA